MGTSNTLASSTSSTSPTSSSSSSSSSSPVPRKSLPIIPSRILHLKIHLAISASRFHHHHRLPPGKAQGCQSASESTFMQPAAPPCDVLAGLRLVSPPVACGVVHMHTCPAGLSRKFRLSCMPSLLITLCHALLAPRGVQALTQLGSLLRSSARRALEMPAVMEPPSWSYHAMVLPSWAMRTACTLQTRVFGIKLQLSQQAATELRCAAANTCGEPATPELAWLVQPAWIWPGLQRLFGDVLMVRPLTTPS